MSEMAQARTRLLRAAVTQGHVWGPISQHGQRITTTCKRCTRGWVSGPTEHEVELTPCTGLRSTGAAGLACVVPGCTRQATHNVSWNHRPTGRAESVQACEPCAHKLLYGARRSKNFRTPAITPLSPQRQKAGAIRCQDCGGAEKYPGEHREFPILHGKTRVEDENADGGRMWTDEGGMNKGLDSLVSPDPDHPGYGHLDTRRLRFDQSGGNRVPVLHPDDLLDDFTPLKHSLNMVRVARQCAACDGTGDFDGVECGACDGTGDRPDVSAEMDDEGVHHFTHDQPAEHIMWNAVAAYDHLKNAHGLSDAEIDRRYKTKKPGSTYWQGNRGAHDDVHAEGVRQRIPHQHGTSTGPDSMRSSGKRAAFDRFQQAADSLMDRAHAQGHHVGIAWGRELLDNAARSDERHTFRCKSCGARDALTRTSTGSWEVSHGSLTNASCTKEKTMAVHKVAHDSGDGETIYHCPFCGSGQVMARSDRTIECEFCHVAFTVQVQPQLSAFPQTVNGAPVQVPGMPGEIGSDAPVQPDDMSAQPPGADPMAPDDLADEEGADGEGAEGDEPMAPDDLAGDDEDEGDEEQQGGGGFSGKPSGQNQPPWLKGNPTKRSMKTIRGATVGEDDMVRSLALRHADDREATMQAVRGSR